MKKAEVVIEWFVIVIIISNFSKRFSKLKVSARHQFIHERFIVSEGLSRERGPLEIQYRLPERPESESETLLITAGFVEDEKV